MGIAREDIRLPGFTAGLSLVRAGQFSASFSRSVARTSILPGGAIRPSTFEMFGLCCDWYDTDHIICGDCWPGVSFGGDKQAAQCRKRCYNWYGNKPQQLDRCLAAC
jgi:hypothetical protein